MPPSAVLDGGLGDQLAERTEAGRAEDGPLRVHVVLRGAAAREGDLADHERVLAQLGHEAVAGVHARARLP
jgi:hypothetical protein